MTAVNVSATFKKDERIFNGLEEIAQDLIKDPLRRHVIVAVIETVRVTRDIKGGTETPTVGLVQVEALDGDAAMSARALLESRYAERTGKEPPPASLFDEVPDAEAAPGTEVAERDPTAGPWPGDADYAEPDSGEQEPKPRRGRKAAQPTITPFEPAAE